MDDEKQVNKEKGKNYQIKRKQKTEEKGWFSVTLLLSTTHEYMHQALVQPC